MPGSHAQTLEALKERVAALQTHPILADSGAVPVPEGLLGTPPGAVHEIFADTPANTGAALGFAFGQARSFLEAGRPGLIFLQLKQDAQELGLPYGLGFSRFGLESEALVLIRTETIPELLWAMEEAIACRAVAAVVADIAYPHRALDFTASRRLALRAAASGASVFLMRYALDREASAAKYRWRVNPLLSASPVFDARAPGPPRWRVRLEKGSLGGKQKPETGEDGMVVDWTEDGFAIAEIGGRSAARKRAAAMARPSFAALGHRLSEAS